MASEGTDASVAPAEGIGSAPSDVVPGTVGDVDGETLTLMTWNINCLLPTVANFKLRHKSFRGFLDHLQVDLACFQEVKLPDARIIREVACVEGFQSFWATSKTKPGYSGVTTWCRSCVAPPHDAAADCLGGDERPELDSEGRMVLTDHGAFVLINVYVPNAGDRPERARLPYKLAFLRALRAKMDELTLQGRQVIAVGDLNIAAERIDVHTALNFDDMYDTEELAELRNLIAAYPDVWRRLHPGEEGAYTVWEERTSARAFNVGLRIDYVLVSPGLLPYVASCEILPASTIPPKWSDHAAIVMRLRVKHNQEGPGPGPQAVSGTSTPLAAEAQDAAPTRLLLPSPPATPCAMWLAMESRFIDRNQRSIKDMFGKRPSGSVPPAKAESATPAKARLKATLRAPPAAGAAAASGVAGGELPGPAPVTASGPPFEFHPASVDGRRAGDEQGAGPESDGGGIGKGRAIGGAGCRKRAAPDGGHDAELQPRRPPAPAPWPSSCGTGNGSEAGEAGVEPSRAEADEAGAVDKAEGDAGCLPAKTEGLSAGASETGLKGRPSNDSEAVKPGTGMAEYAPGPDGEALGSAGGSAGPEPQASGGAGDPEAAAANNGSVVGPSGEGAGSGRDAPGGAGEQPQRTVSGPSGQGTDRAAAGPRRAAGSATVSGGGRTSGAKKGGRTGIGAVQGPAKRSAAAAAAAAGAKPQRSIQAFFSKTKPSSE